MVSSGVTIEGGNLNCIVGYFNYAKNYLFDILQTKITPPKGLIFIDGQDISQIKPDSLKKIV